MAFVPVYAAYLNNVQYSAISGWITPITYNRRTTRMGALAKHEAPANSITLAMRPVMSPAVLSIGGADYVNDGVVDGGRYSSQVISGNAADYGFVGDWNFSRFMQVQMAMWNTHEASREAFVAALEARDIEDVWITKAGYVKPAGYQADIDAGAVTQTVVKNSDPYGIMGEMPLTTAGKPSPNITANPCVMQAFWPYGIRRYDIVEVEEGFIAFSDGLPAVEVVARESCHVKYTQIEGDTSSLPLTPIFTPSGIPLYLKNIQSWMWEQNATSPVGGTVIPGLDYIHYWETDGPAAGPLSLAQNYRITNHGTQVDPVAPNLFTMSGYPLEQRFYDDGTPEGLNNERQVLERPVKWKHDDPEFIGYFPYFYELLSNSGLVEDYIKNPDDRFDGFRFLLKVKISTITRSWFSHTYNRLINTDAPGLFGKFGKIQAYAFRDTETGEVINSAPDCSLIPPQAVFFSPDLVPSPTYPGFDWDGYDWPDLTIDLTPGTFLLEDGSAAPIYPTFYGAYVYDMHLKKWGRYDEPYKRLLDYAAINTYMPNTSSYKRVGIYGGSLNAEGKIRIFDENPATSWIKYGKIGYYRQGMTSVEEVRAHHRVGATGVLSVESSVEGKLVDPTISVTTAFDNSVMWTHGGSYSAKWHNIVISGKFDLSYLEFRGIISGRR